MGCRADWPRRRISDRLSHRITALADDPAQTAPGAPRPRVVPEEGRCARTASGRAMGVSWLKPNLKIIT